MLPYTSKPEASLFPVSCNDSAYRENSYASRLEFRRIRCATQRFLFRPKFAAARQIGIIASVAIIALLGTQSSFAEVSSDPLDPDQTASDIVSFDLAAGFSSDYIFRGRELYDGFSFQPSATLRIVLDDASSVSGTLWSQLPFNGEQRDSNLFEVDGTLIYDRQVGSTVISLGHIGYAYAESIRPVKNTAELFAAMFVDTYLQPRITVFYDYLNFDSYYYELSLSQRVEVDVFRQPMNFSPFAVFGWSASAPREVYARDGLSQITYGLLSDYGVGDFRVMPNISYSQKIDPLTVNTFLAGLVVQWGR